MNRASSISRSALLMLVFVFVVSGWPAHAEDYWGYRGEITSKGTRSEGFIGSLSYHGKVVPSKLGQIITPIGEYKFEPSKAHPWAHQGWLKTSNLPISSESNIPFSNAKPEESHWYRDGKRRNTSSEWIYVPAFRYWLDPEYLQQFSDEVLATITDAEKSPVAAFLDDGAAKSDRDVFVYKESTTDEGSKSAGSRGALLYNDKPLQWPGTLKTPIGTFFYVRSDKLWEPQGWFSTKDVATKDSAVPVDVAELKKGSYKGLRRADTPSDWCYAPEVDTWYSPEQLR